MNQELNTKIERAAEAFTSWRGSSFEERRAVMLKAAELFRERAEELGRIASEEMYKPITQAIAEAQKCALAFEYYAEHGEKFLSPKHVETDASESYVSYEPMGVILAVMPWNFPFWQVARFAAPVLMGGNVGVLKHASNVPRSAQAFEDLLRDAGAPEGTFINLAIGSKDVEQVLKHSAVKGVALTGSEYAGMQVAGLAGSLIKPAVMELGGSDPFIVLADADIDYAAEVAVKARLQNNGQSCIAAKRFIIVEEVYDAFLEKFKAGFAAANVGDPLDPSTDVGPIVDEKALEELLGQIERSVEKGAKVEIGGQKLEMEGNYLAPTILTDVAPGMPAYEEELFGPVASVIKAKDEADAMRIANDSRFGLGSSIWTQDNEKAKRLAPQIEAGCVFVNEMVKSDPRLPFGGTGISGFGRELSVEGLMEFVNVKTVWVK